SGSDPEPGRGGGAKGPETLPLADRVGTEAPVLPNLVSCLVHDGPRAEGLGGALSEKLPVVTHYEAEILALRGCRRSQSSCARLGAHLRLAEAAHREAGPGQLGLGQRPEKVALVLRLIPRGQQAEPARARIRRQARVMARRDRICIPGQGPLKQGAEFDLAVAYGARARRSACQILAREVCDHPSGEFLLVVD